MAQPILDALVSKFCRRYWPRRLVARGMVGWPLLDRMARRAASVPHPPPPPAPVCPAEDIPPDTVVDADGFTETRLREAIRNAAGTGRRVLLPPGRLVLREPLPVPSRVSLVGTPGRTELLFPEGPYGLVVRGNGDGPVRDVRLAHLRVRHASADATAAVLATGASGLVFEDLRLDAAAVGFLFADGVHGVRAERCEASRAGLLGFALVRDVTDGSFYDCVADGCVQSGVFLTDLKLPEGMDPLDFGAQVEHTHTVIGNFGPFAPDDPSPCRNVFHRCAFRNNRKQGITTDGVGMLRVLDCTLADNDCEGITLDNGSWCCEVRGCHVRGNGRRAFQRETELADDFVDHAGMMEDGSSTAKLPGVSCDNAAFCRIEHNLIEGNYGDGVKFVRAVHGVTVARNLIADNNRGLNRRHHFFGVLLGADPRQHPDQYDFPSNRNLVEANDILGAHYAGVHLLAGTASNAILRNRIVGATRTPIEDHSRGGNRIRRIPATGGQA